MKSKLNLDELAEQIGEVQLPALPERKILNEILKHLLLAKKQNAELLSAIKNLDKLIDTKSEDISKIAARLDALAQLKTLKNNKLDTLHLMLLGVAALQSLVILFLIFKL